LIRDLFAQVVQRLDVWCESGFSQMARLAGKSPARPPRSPARHLAVVEHALAEP